MINKYTSTRSLCKSKYDYVIRVGASKQHSRAPRKSNNCADQDRNYERPILDLLDSTLICHFSLSSSSPQCLCCNVEDKFHFFEVACQIQLKYHNHGKSQFSIHCLKFHGVWESQLLKYLNKHSQAYWCCLLFHCSWSTRDSFVIVIHTRDNRQKKGQRQMTIFSARNTRLRCFN